MTRITDDRSKRLAQYRSERLARYQSVVREINAQVEDSLRGGDASTRVDAFLCECASVGCFEHVTMTHSEYGRVRARGTMFVVFPDESHVVADVERVVERNDRYWIVEPQDRSGSAAGDDPSRIVDAKVRWRFDWGSRP